MERTKKNFKRWGGVAIGMLVICGLVTAGVMTFLWQGQYGVNTPDLYYLDGEPCTGSIDSVTVTMHPGNNTTWTHTLSLDSNYPGMKWVDFVVNNDTELNVTILDDDDNPITEMQLSSTPQTFTIYAEVKPLATTGSYNFDVTIQTKSFGY